MQINIDRIYKILQKEVKNFKILIVDEVEHSSNDVFKVLITTILSARTNDITTAKVVNKLFKEIKNLQDLEKASLKKIQNLIYPVGFYKNKAKHLKKLPIVLKKEFNNKIPETIDELIKLPGVGRKTANLVRVIAFKKLGICVDTHVHKIMNRIGYVKTKNPLQTEMALRKKLPKKYWLKINSILVAFGQNLCRPVNPKCNICPIYDYCKRIGVKTKNEK